MLVVVFYFLREKYIGNRIQGDTGGPALSIISPNKQKHLLYMYVSLHAARGLSNVSQNRIRKSVKSFEIK
jgi:hypothetical protein